jgi:chromosome segregation and condensation protein ScpB
MSGKVGMKHYGAQIIESVLKLRDEGKSHKEIAEIFGLESSNQVRELVRANKRRQSKPRAKPRIKAPGGRLKGLELSENQKDMKIRTLEMQVELLRNFAKEIGRGWR